MSDHLKLVYNLNYPHVAQNATMDSTDMNLSKIPQSSSRPTTLPIGSQFINRVSFTPNDHKVALSTPELINALTTPVTNEGPPMQGANILDALPPTHIRNSNRPMLPTMNSFDHSTFKIVSNTNYQQQDNIPTNPVHRSNSPVSSYNPSVNSMTMDNESSNLTSSSAASPLSTIQHFERSKDELQHAPSSRTKFHEDQNDFLRREKKRERNRQAAQKCRTRKLTRIAELQKRVSELQGKNKDLNNMAESLKSDITHLEQRLYDHHTQGCLLMNGSIL